MKNSEFLSNSKIMTPEMIKKTSKPAVLANFDQFLEQSTIFTFFLYEKDTRSLLAIRFLSNNYISTRLLIESSTKEDIATGLCIDSSFEKDSTKELPVTSSTKNCIRRSLAIDSSTKNCMQRRLRISSLIENRANAILVA